MRTSGRLATVAVVLVLALVASACGGSSSETSTTQTPPSDDSTTTVVIPPDGFNPDSPAGDPPRDVPFDPDNPPTGSETPLFEAGNIDPGLVSFVELAVKDLARRLDAAPTDIEIHSAVLVVWPDSSLGCPDPDMKYQQVPEDGSLIELSYEGRIFSYHTGGTQTTPFLCEQPLKEAPPTSDNGGESN